MASAHDVEAAELQRDIEQTRASLEKNIGTLAGEVRSTINRASHVTDAVTLKLDRAFSAADSIKLHPYRSMFLAAVVGGVVGVIWGRYRREPRPLGGSSVGSKRAPALAGLFEPELTAIRARAVDALLDGIRVFLLRYRKKSG
jgi:ElaB/YqjD/DUF883 family membrane-anchored ribosome-binding protein